MERRKVPLAEQFSEAGGRESIQAITWKAVVFAVTADFAMIDVVVAEVAEIEVGERVTLLAPRFAGCGAQPGGVMLPQQKALIVGPVNARKHTRLGIVEPRANRPLCAFFIVNGALRPLEEGIVQPGVCRKE